MSWYKRYTYNYAIQIRSRSFVNLGFLHVDGEELSGCALRCRVEHETAVFVKRAQCNC